MMLEAGVVLSGALGSAGVTVAPSRGGDGHGCLPESRRVKAEPPACWGTPGPETSLGCARFLTERAFGLLLPLLLFCICSY